MSSNKKYYQEGQTRNINGRKWFEQGSDNHQKEWKDSEDNGVDHRFNFSALVYQ